MHPPSSTCCAPSTIPVTAIAHGADKGDVGDRKVLIYDTMRNPFDATLLTVEDAIFQVKAASDDMRVSVEAFDNRSVDCHVRSLKRNK